MSETVSNSSPSQEPVGIEVALFASEFAFEFVPAVLVRGLEIERRHVCPAGSRGLKRR